jgi:glycosyltransferase domain-containing protein
MVSPLKEKTAILIPLFGRKEFTERLLKYLDEKKCIYPIYLSDGSKKTQFTRTYLKNYYKFLKIIYLRFPHDKNYILYSKKVYETIKIIKAKYIFSLTNDDFVNLNFIKKAELFLDDNKDYVFVGGLVYKFRIIQLFKWVNDFGYFKELGIFYKKSNYKNINSSNIAKRVKLYECAFFHECLIRRETLLKTWEYIYKFKTYNHIEQLWFQLIMPLIIGKKKLFKFISVLRQSNTYFSEGQNMYTLSGDKKRYDAFVNFLIKKKFIKSHLVIKTIKKFNMLYESDNLEKKKKLFFYYYVKIKSLFLRLNSFFFDFYFRFNNKNKYSAIYKKINNYF